ncbi:glycerate kinase type-2 family protein [Pelomicrobium sp. G1]|uniref:glycerate kinase type-2 family protein n=1 Tax=unclassified Pelomicrobium TaxID=2815318 RepID=UPI003F7692DB
MAKRTTEPRTLLIESFRAAVAAADPLRIVPRHLPPPPKGRTLVVGAGKAAASMAKAVEDHWPAEAPLSGLVITRYQHGLPTRRIRVVEAGHPVPDESGEAAAREILEEVKRVGPDDLVLALVSGGGSSLLSLPAPGIGMVDLKAVTRELLACGASIQEINTVRKHLSLIQGGRLAAASQAPVLALIVSDVTGDDPTHIASGPFAPDPTTYEDALAILRDYRIEPPPAVRAHLERGRAGDLPETPKPGDPVFARVENRIIATAHGSLVAAGEYFRRRRIPTAILGDSVTGEAREVAQVYAALAREVRAYGHPWRPPVALICGGETTVTVQGKGRGGRNCEFLLALTLALDALPDVHALACDTDGIDGTEDNAGAVCGPETLARARTLGLDGKERLADNDGYTFFERLGDLVISGPTRTNVNDYRAILIL